MSAGYGNYREMLRSQWETRRFKNRSYSLRSFARDLGLHSSTLSLILSGDRGLSLDRAHELVRRLKLKKSDARVFLSLVELDQANDPERKNQILTGLQKLTKADHTVNVSVDVFRAISEWYHLAIIELTRVKGADLSPKGIADALAITVTASKDAIERLIRLGLVKKLAGNRLEASFENFKFESEIPDQAFQRYHRETIEKAVESIPTQHASSRYLAGQAIAIHTDELPKIKEMLSKNWKDINEMAEAIPVKDSVYQLCVQFFRLDQKKEGKLNANS